MWQWLQDTLGPTLAIISTFALGGSAIAGLAFWLFKILAERWLNHSFTKRLEAFRHEQSKELEHLKSELKVRDEQLKSLRDAALNQLGIRTATLDKRRLEAAEHVWGAVVDSWRFKFASKMTTALKIDEMLKRAPLQNSEGEKIRAFAAHLWKIWALENTTQINSPDKERPFISALAWAKFSTYRSAMTLPVTQISAIMNGVGPRMIRDTEPLVNAAKAAFPKWANFIEEHGTSAFPFIVDDMEEEVLQEIVSSVENGSSNSKHLETARQIVSDVAKFSESLQEKPVPPLS